VTECRGSPRAVKRQRPCGAEVGKTNDPPRLTAPSNLFDGRHDTANSMGGRLGL